ncbi:MAG: polyamine ABC transporter substrate-binding protein [Alphaproteobacteria bacterium]
MRRAVLMVVAALVAGVAAVLGPARAEEEKLLSVYNWSDYVAPDTLQNFTAETGIKVNYDTYDKNEMLSAKLTAGRSGYDVVFPSASPHLALQIKAGLYQKLNKSKLTNLGNMDPKVLEVLAVSDPGNLYGVPYMVSATGFGYNVAMVAKALPGARTESWAMLFDPATTAKLKGCGVTLLDDPVEVLPAALAYMGRQGVSLSADDLKASAETVTKVRPNLKYIHSSNYINDLANGDICVAHGYVGDLAQARKRAEEAGKGVRIAITIPKEGAILNVDAMAIPADAPHPDNAHRFIDYMMRPKVIADITNAVGYASANSASMALVDKAIREDPAIYPPAEVRARTFIVPVPNQDFERARNRAWMKIRTGK